MLAGPDVGETYTLREDSILVGRGSQCQLQINSPHVSRQQCEMSWQGDQLVLENLGTVNHTYLNDRPIERVYVQDGDLITFCDIALRVRIPREGASPGPDPERTVAYGASSLDSRAGAPLPAAGGGAPRIQPGASVAQETHPPGPLGGGPPPPPGSASGGLGTATYGHMSGQHPSHRPPGLPPGIPPQGPSSQHGMPPGMPPQAPPSQRGMPQGSPSEFGGGGNPGALAPGMPSPPPGMPQSPGGGPRQGQRRPSPGSSSVITAKKKDGKKRKGRKGPTNLPLIRNIVLVATAVIVLLSFAYALTQPVKVVDPTGGGAISEPEATPAPPPRNDRTDQEIVQEAQRLFNIGSTYLRQYQIADENLWTSVDFIRRSKAQLTLVPHESWPGFSGELDRKIGKAEGLLDQQFRRIKLSYIREKSAGNLDRALAEMERLQRIFPDKADERYLFARKQKQVLNRMMSGKKGTSVFGN